MTGAVAEALLAMAAGDLEQGRRLSHDAIAGAPESLVAPALADFLSGVGGDGVYDEPSGFEEFIDNGGNVSLYAKTIDVLVTAHAAIAPLSLLDIGCGDGRVTTAVVEPSTVVDLVEPSAPLLATAMERLNSAGISATAHGTGIAQLLDQIESERSWDAVQATFAMHALAPQERNDVLRRLGRRSKRLLLVEFDVPAFADRSPEHADYAAERYEIGLREYRDHPNVVSQFLLPVLVGQFDQAQPRHTFEQPVDAWCDQLSAAGWRRVTPSPIADYWWAQAFLIEAER